MSNVTPTPGPLGARYVSGEVPPVAKDAADAGYVSCGTAMA
jgi:hypothetical protein